MILFSAFFILLVYLAGVFAAKEITYRVVVDSANLGNMVGVAIGQDIYALDKDPGVPMLYVGRGPSESHYRYVILDSPETKNMIDFEKFERPAIIHADATFNEVFGRPWNLLRLDSLPTLYEPRVPNNTPSRLFEDGTIATMHFEANEDEIAEMHANKLKKIKVSGRLTYINYDSVQQFDQVKIKMGGHSSREWSKVPYRVKIPVDTAPQGLYRRWDLKLRPGATDPTMLREKVYDDLLQAVGVTAAKGTYVRFYINDTPVGLYLLADDSASDSFIRETFHQGNPNVALGEFVQGDAGKGDYAANLGFLGETEEAYDDKVYDVKIDGPDDQSDAMASLISFMKFIRDYNPQTVPDSEKVLELWEPWIDMISYLRQAAIEWIGGNWDGIQYSGNNYALYRVPSTEQYMAIPMDFDFTFGNGLEEDQQHLLTGKWSQFTQDRIIHSYLWENIRQTPYLVRLYESILADVNQNVSNPQKMNDRIDALAYMIQHDVNWDRSLPRLTVGKTRSASRNFLDSLEQGTDDLDERIGLKEWVREKYAAINRDVGAQGSEDDTQEADTLPEKEDA